MTQVQIFEAQLRDLELQVNDLRNTEFVITHRLCFLKVMGDLYPNNLQPAHLFNDIFLLYERLFNVRQELISKVREYHRILHNLFILRMRQR